MPTHTLSQTIRAPLPDVFTAVTDLASYSEWNPTTKSARVLSEGPVGDGARIEFEIQGMGKQELEVTNYEEN